MRRIHRIVVLATLTLIAPVLAGCADFDMDKLDVFHLNEKKKLPGKRIPLFPNGVPGVSQGIPPEYMKGYQPPPDQTADGTLGQPAGAAANGTTAQPGEQRTAAVTPVQSKPEPKAKPKPKRHVVRHKVKHKPKPKPKAPAPQPVSQPQQNSPWPAPGQQPQQQNNSAPWPAPQPTPDNSAWPAPPPTGTFSKQ